MATSDYQEAESKSSQGLPLSYVTNQEDDKKIKPIDWFWFVLALLVALIIGLCCAITVVYYLSANLVILFPGMPNAVVIAVTITSAVVTFALNALLYYNDAPEVFSNNWRSLLQFLGVNEQTDSAHSSDWYYKLLAHICAIACGITMAALMYDSAIMMFSGSWALYAPMWLIWVLAIANGLGSYTLTYTYAKKALEGIKKTIGNFKQDPMRLAAFVLLNLLSLYHIYNFSVTCHNAMIHLQWHPAFAGLCVIGFFIIEAIFNARVIEWFICPQSDSSQSETVPKSLILGFDKTRPIQTIGITLIVLSFILINAAANGMIDLGLGVVNLDALTIIILTIGALLSVMVMTQNTSDFICDVYNANTAPVNGSSKSKPKQMMPKAGNDRRYASLVTVGTLLGAGAYYINGFYPDLDIWSACWPFALALIVMPIFWSLMPQEKDGAPGGPGGQDSTAGVSSTTFDNQDGTLHHATGLDDGHRPLTEPVVAP